MPAGPVLSTPDPAVPPSARIRRVNSAVIAKAGIADVYRPQGLKYELRLSPA